MVYAVVTNHPPGKEQRQALVLILRGSTKPATTLAERVTPKDLRKNYSLFQREF
jgi:hypothetical protein